MDQAPRYRPFQTDGQPPSLAMPPACPALGTRPDPRSSRDARWVIKLRCRRLAAAAGGRCACFLEGPSPTPPWPAPTGPSASPQMPRPGGAPRAPFQRRLPPVPASHMPRAAYPTHAGRVQGPCT